MQIGIFNGKKGRYNKLILKALYEKGMLSAWHIARYIVDETEKKEKKRIKDWYHATQKVSSVLARKEGRLQELLAKEFIERTDCGYTLTFNKGLCSALALYERVEKPAIEFPRKVLPELKELIEIIAQQHPESVVEGYKEMRNTAMALINKGLNIDLITNEQFNLLFQSQMEESFISSMKEKETREEQKMSPETQERIYRVIASLADRIEKVTLEKLEELRSLQIRYAHSAKQNDEDGAKTNSAEDSKRRNK